MVQPAASVTSKTSSLRFQSNSSLWSSRCSPDPNKWVTQGLRWSQTSATMKLTRCLSDHNSRSDSQRLYRDSKCRRNKSEGRYQIPLEVILRQQCSKSKWTDRRSSTQQTWLSTRKTTDRQCPLRTSRNSHSRSRWSDHPLRMSDRLACYLQLGWIIQWWSKEECPIHHQLVKMLLGKCHSKEFHRLIIHKLWRNHCRDKTWLRRHSRSINCQKTNSSRHLSEDPHNKCLKDQDLDFLARDSDLPWWLELTNKSVESLLLADNKYKHQWEDIHDLKWDSRGHQCNNKI